MRFPLHQGAYAARGVIANAQRCINLFGEQNPQDAPFPLTHYPASGTSVYADYTGILSGITRGLHWASSVGRMFAVVGTAVIEVLGAGQNYTLLGHLDSDTGNPVKMSDNGLVMLMVDGSPHGYTLTFASNAFGTMGDLVGPGIAPPTGVTLAPVDVVITQNMNSTTTYYPSNMELVVPDWAGLQAYGGVTLWVGMRVLVAAQSDARQNGVYNLAQIGVSADPFNQPMALYRAADMNNSAQLSWGMLVPQAQPNNPNAQMGLWQLQGSSAAGPPTLDVSNLNWALSSFMGGSQVDFIDTFFIVNRPGTPTFMVSPSNWNGTDAWDPNYWAEKIGFSDILVGLAALHDNIWLLGSVTTEVWFNSGAPDFPFQRMGNSMIQQGCIAPYSVVIADNAVFWLSQDRYGRAMLMRGEGYQAQRVSNFAVEHEWANYYGRSCIGMAYQQAGHEIVLLFFPVANATWGYDTMTKLWHRRTYGPNSDAWLPYCASWFGSRPYSPTEGPSVSLAGDRTGPRILQIDRFTYTDCGTPIERIRSWPHLLNDEKRMSHTDFSAHMTPTNLQPDAVTLRWSDDGGQTWGNPVVQAAGGAGWPESYGQYSWSRLGYARDRVYELSWSSTGETALNGAWVQAEPAET